MTARETGDAQEVAWSADLRERVRGYLAREGISDANVGDWPAWHVFPVVAIWAVESATHPGWVGWWAISGDLPTDYATCSGERHPRAGLRDIAESWQRAADNWSDGKPDESIRIGSSKDSSRLAPLLASRARLLLTWAADDTLWGDCTRNVGPAA